MARCIQNAVREIIWKISPAVWYARVLAVPARQSHPNRTAALHLSRQRAIVNQFASDLLDSTNPPQRRRPDQYTAARRPGRFRPPGRQSRRADTTSEKRKETPGSALARRTIAPQLHHERNQIQPIRLGSRDQSRHIVRSMHDVGVGKQQVIRPSGQALHSA